MAGMFNSLRFKLVMFLVLTALLGILLALVFARVVVLPKFVSLEQNTIAEHLTTARMLINRDAVELERIVYDWAAWDDTYAFVERPNQEYVDSNLPFTTFVGGRFNLIFIYNRAGEYVFGKSYDLNTEQELPFAEFPVGAPPADPKLLQHHHPLDKLSGLMQTEHGILLFASRPIVTSLDQGPIRGTVVFGRLFEPRLLPEISEVSQLQLQVLPLQGEALLPSEQALAAGMLKRGDDLRFEPTSANSLTAYGLLRDYRGQPEWLLKFTHPRETYAIGMETINTFLVVAFFGILAAALAQFSRLQHLVFQPLQELTEFVQKISQNQELSTRLPPRRPDEIGKLVSAFNDLNARQKHLIGELWGNISELRVAEQTVRASEASFRNLSEEFKAVLDGIPDSLMQLDRHGRVIWANPAAEEELRLLRQHSAAARPESALTFPGFAGSVSERVFGHGTIEDELDETIAGRIYGVKAFPIRDAQLGVRSVIRLSSDITEKIRLREETNRASRLASLGELSAGMAHEINNPNAVILANTQLLGRIFQDLLPILHEYFDTHEETTLGGMRSGRVLKELPELLAEMAGGGERIRRIVNDLKDFVRVDDPSSRETVDLNEIIGTASRLAGATVRKATDHFSLDLAAELPRVSVNVQQIEQVLINLIQNACQALPDRSCKVSVQSEFDAKLGLVVINVCDEGKGIEPHILPHVFDPFFTTRRDEGGTGLGLSVSMRLIRGNRGFFDIKSKPGQGSCFSIGFPPVQPEKTV